MRPIRSKFKSLHRIGYVGIRYDDLVKVLGQPRKWPAGSDSHVSWDFKLPDEFDKGSYRYYSIYDDNFGDDEPIQNCKLWDVGGSTGKTGTKVSSSYLSDIKKLFPSALVSEGRGLDFWTFLDKVNREVAGKTMKAKYNALARLEVSSGAFRSAQDRYDNRLPPDYYADDPWTDEYYKEISSVEGAANKVMNLLGYKEKLDFKEVPKKRYSIKDNYVEYKAEDLSLKGVRSPSSEELKELFQKACGETLRDRDILNNISEDDAEIGFDYALDSALRCSVYFNYSHKNGVMTEVWATYSVTFTPDDGY